MAEVMTSPTARVLDRRLWRIDQGVRELVAECYRTRTGRTKMIWLVPEASLHGRPISTLNRRALNDS
jgi:hypothetical protein